MHSFNGSTPLNTGSPYLTTVPLLRQLHHPRTGLHHQDSSACLKMILLPTSIIWILAYHLYARATLPIHPNPKLLTHQKNYITLPVVVDFGIISTSSLLPMEAPSSTLGSFHYCLVPMHQYPKQPVVNQLTCSHPNISTSSTWTLLSVTASRSGATNLLSSLLIRPHATIGCLASNHSNTMTFKRPSSHSATRLVLLLINSDATAMRSFSAAQYDHSYTPTTHLLPPVWRDTNLATALSRPIGKSWYKCPGVTLLNSKCPKHSDTTPSSTQPE
jgi:hypothetical protein